MTADLGHHYIAGAWRSDAPHGSHPVENPSDGSVIGTAPDGSAELAREAVMAARTTFATTDWASNPRHRAAALLEFADILESRADAIAALMARENGKLLAQARLRAHRTVRTACGSLALWACGSGRRRPLHVAGDQLHPHGRLGQQAVRPGARSRSAGVRGEPHARGRAHARADRCALHNINKVPSRLRRHTGPL